MVSNSFGARVTVVFLIFFAATAYLNTAARLQAEEPTDIYARGYFGEAIRGLSTEDRLSFDRGSALFTRRWDAGNSFARNASSCVSCHSVPMPAGSGMTEQALVNVTLDESGRTVVQQRIRPDPMDAQKFDRSAVRRTPPLFGLGLLENAQVESKVAKSEYLGAFAEESSLYMFVSKAFAVELGISSKDFCARESTRSSYPRTCEPAISEQELSDVVTFIRFLAAPPRLEQPSSKRGAELFKIVGCAVCHTPELRILDTAPEPIKGRVLMAFTDRRTHDLGFVRPLKTAPLWGLNSIGPPYMHNAQASSIEAAIQIHGGTAKISSDRFGALSSDDRDALLEYLKGL